MAIETPNYPEHAALGALDSRPVDPEKLDWSPTRFEGVEMKVLMEDKETGLMTALFRWQPGAVLPFHEHTDIEQTYMLEGRLEDEQGSIGPGEYVWRPAGSRHVARAPEGALMLSMFHKPNQFLDEDA
jgi:anti-sigma factor ChrR (cupin superfamily)